MDEQNQIDRMLLDYIDENRDRWWSMFVRWCVLTAWKGRPRMGLPLVPV